MNVKLSSLLLLGIIACFSVQAADFDFKYPRSTVNMQLKQVSEHVYFVQGATGIATDNQGFIYGRVLTEIFAFERAVTSPVVRSPVRWVAVRYRIMGMM